MVDGIPPLREVGGTPLSGRLLIPMEFGLGFAFEKLLDYNFGVQLFRNEKG